jgi:hypothetical protein
MSDWNVYFRRLIHSGAAFNVGTLFASLGMGIRSAAAPQLWIFSSLPAELISRIFNYVISHTINSSIFRWCFQPSHPSGCIIGRFLLQAKYSNATP